MNKRQRKKKYTEMFSKFYDRSVKDFGKSPQITINLFNKRRGGKYMMLSATNSINILATSDMYHPEINIEGAILMERRVY